MTKDIYTHFISCRGLASSNLSFKEEYREMLERDREEYLVKQKLLEELNAIDVMEWHKVCHQITKAHQDEHSERWGQEVLRHIKASEVLSEEVGKMWENEGYND